MTFDSIWESVASVGSAFDYFSPAAAFITDIMHGGSRGFVVPIDQSPLTGKQIKRLLRSKGVDSWGYVLPAFTGTLVFSVAKEDGEWAEHVLDRAGVPTEGAATRATPIAPVSQRPPGDASASWHPAFETFEELQEWWEE